MIPFTSCIHFWSHSLPNFRSATPSPKKSVLMKQWLVSRGGSASYSTCRKSPPNGAWKLLYWLIQEQGTCIIGTYTQVSPSVCYMCIVHVHNCRCVCVNALCILKGQLTGMISGNDSCSSATIDWANLWSWAPYVYRQFVYITCTLCRAAVSWVWCLWHIESGSLWNSSRSQGQTTQRKIMTHSSWEHEGHPVAWQAGCVAPF